MLPGTCSWLIAVKKLSISLDADALQAAREAARRQGMSLSARLSYAAAETAKLEQARAALDEYVAEFGEPDAETEARVQAALDAAGVGRPEPPEQTRALSASRTMLKAGSRVLVPSVVLAQAWRDDERQHALRKLCGQCEHLPFTEDAAKSVGGLLKASDTTDIVDAAVVVSAIQHGAAVMTSDPDDLGKLIEASGVDVPLITV